MLPTNHSLPISHNNHLRTPSLLLLISLQVSRQRLLSPTTLAPTLLHLHLHLALLRPLMLVRFSLLLDDNSEAD